MESIEGKKIINTMQQELLKNGIVIESLISNLKDLRPFAIKEEDPTLTKVIRLTYEHLEEHGTFNIAIPDDVLDEDEEEEEEGAEEATEGGDDLVFPEAEPVDMNDFEAKRESMLYLFEIMIDARHKMNRVDLIGYRDSLMKYAEEHA